MELSGHQDEPAEKYKIKMKRDPLLPKRPSNAFVLYCKEARAKLAADHPELSFGELAAKLGDMWQMLSPAEKKPYEETARDDRARHARELEAYRSGSGSGGHA